jgi:effector-binding domain-containing protein
MFRIGEFSRLVRVSARMLRHYEKCGLLYPAKIDAETGYRYYSAAQMPLLGRIVALRDTGFTVAEIGGLIQRFGDGPYMEKAFRAKARQLEASIAGEQAKLERLSTLKDYMNKERFAMVYEVEIKELPKMNVLALREVIPNYASEGMLWQELGQYMARSGVVPSAGACGYSIYWDDEYKERDVDVEVALPVDTAVKGGDDIVCREVERVERAAAVRFSGAYGSFSAAAEKLAGWVEANGYDFGGPMRSVIIRGPHNESDPQNYLTELQLPVRKK